MIEELRGTRGGLESFAESTLTDDEKEKLDQLYEGKEAGVSPGELDGREAIILTTGRPALLVQNGKWEPAKIEEIQRRLDEAGAGLAGAVRRVGGDRDPGGLRRLRGHWLDDRGGRDGHQPSRRRTVRPLPPRGPCLPQRRRRRRAQVRADFLREHKRADQWAARLAEVLFVEENSEARPDMPLLRTNEAARACPSPSRSTRASSACATTSPPWVPWRGIRATTSSSGRTSSRTSTGVKRLSPGQGSGVREDGMVLVHDCTTMGGSS